MPPEEITDDTPMYFGKHKGKRMADVPPEYLWWAWEGANGPQHHALPSSTVHKFIVKNWKRLCRECPDYDPAHQPPRDTRTATQAPAK